MKLDRKHYKTHTENFYKGKIVVSTKTLRNGWCELPIGTKYTITRKFKGFNLTSFPCGQCGAKQYISRVQPFDLKLLLEQPFEVKP